MGRLLRGLAGRTDRGARGRRRLDLLALDHVQHALAVVPAPKPARVIRFLGETVAGAPGSVQ